MGNRRTTELLLLIAASPIVILLFTMALLNSDEAITVQSLAVPLLLFAAFIISHLAVRFFAPKADPAILPIVFMLSGIGIAFVMRLAPDLALRQIMWLFLSIAVMIAVLAGVRSIKKLGNYKYTIMLIGIVLLLLPAFIGTEHYGSKIWLNFAGFSFQPGEIAKVLIVLFLAAYLAENREMLSISKRRLLGIKIPDFKTLMPLLVMWIISMLIVVFERDLGSALLFFGLFLVMIYVATGRKSFIVVGILLAAVGGTAAYLLFSHVQTRVAIWIDPFAYANESGYQLVQAFYSMADGGLFGTGIGRGLPTKIPVVESDFIFSAIAEEAGLLGAAGVLLLYLLFAIRGFTIAGRARTDIDAFTAVGLTSAISLQAFVIVGGVTGLIPLTGITLPFMSQGGSSLLASFIIVAFLLRAGDDATGVEEEIQGTTTLDGGVLGRVALGKRLTVLITIFALLFALLIANLTNLMVVKAEEIQDMPTNNHTLAHAATVERGSILTSDGVVLARSVETADGTYEREYPEQTLAAHVIGYSSAQYGTAGLESTQSETLTGNKNFATWSDAINSLAGGSTSGNDIQLTLNSEVQRVAESVLEGEVGAVVALDPETGAVLAMASAPTYDVGDVTALLDGSTESDALFNRAASGLYAPGSTFKMVTLTAALENGVATLDTVYDSPSSIDIGNAPITNFDENAYGAITLRRAIEVSSNTVFAQVADEVGAENLVETAQNFGFGTTIGKDFTVRTSLMPDPLEMTEWETAWAGVGQPVGEHESPAGPQASVVQMALVGAAFANDGVIMNPYIVDCVLSSDGEITSTTLPSQLCVATTPSIASEVLEALEGVVDEGTGTAAQISGATVAGKTGTAQTGASEDNSWFVGMAEIDGKKVVVAVVIEQVDAGTATSKARQVLEAGLKAQGVL